MAKVWFKKTNTNKALQQIKLVEVARKRTKTPTRTKMN
jgi:hypothetical protein